LSNIKGISSRYQNIIRP